MSDELDRFDESISVEVLERIEPVCQEFEDAWRTGQRPEIESFLDEVEDVERAPLLRYLLPLDIVYRRQRGSDPLPDEYCDCFSDSTDLINAVFRASGVGANYTPDLPRRIGRFEILEFLGQGNFGIVYKAHDPKLDYTFAIKLARPETLSTEEKVERFLREARSAVRLKHPNIVQAHAIEYHNEIPFIVTDFVEGLTLEERLSGVSYNFREAAEWVAQVAAALEYAHREGVIHRDVKPSNILLDRAGKPYLTDFGLAHRDEEEIHLTRPGEVMGTRAYMSPEQTRGDEADARCDVYSVGVVFFQLLTGELPFRGKPHMLSHQVQFDEPPPPRRLNDQVPHDLNTICLKCLEKEPKARYETAQALSDELQRYLNGEPIKTRPITRFERAWRWCRRNPLVSSLTVSLLVVVVLWLRAEGQAKQAELRLLKTQLELVESLQKYEQYETDQPDVFDLDRLIGGSIEYEVPDLAALARKYLPTLTGIVARPERELRIGASTILGRLAEDLGSFAEQRGTLGDDANEIIDFLDVAASALEEAADDKNPDVSGTARQAGGKIDKALAQIRSVLDVNLRDTTLQD